tara:strand:+ start:57714 stop:58889 length:1176 start_codon:yes stop_codon:yes gene_type:complete
MEAPKPANENQRLRALHELDILDTAPEESFDRITRLAASIVDAPIVLVSLVDEDRQWFKSTVGLDATETPREVAFCAHAILDTSVMVVPDAREDARFADNALVTGPHDVRFYAGAPLMLNDDVRLGTLCAIDTKPRQLDPDQETALRDLAAIVVDELRLRHLVKKQGTTNKVLEKQTAKLEQANQSLQQFAYMASHDLRGPLKTIINMADIVMLSSEDAEQESLQYIRDAAANLEQMVAGYYRLSRFECTEMKTHLVSKLIDDSKNVASNDIVVEIVGDASIHCDATLMLQVFTNLINNASNYASEKVVLFETESTDSETVIRVKNSVESSVSTDKELFAPFRRMTTEGDGMGLGLAIVDRITQLHEGSVSASCEDGCFCVELRIPNGDSK